jgi:hypothetical protein
MFNFRSKEQELIQQSILEQSDDKGDKNKKPKGGNPPPQKEQRERKDRDRTDPGKEATIKNRLLNIQNRRSTDPFDLGFPIDVVISNISEEKSNNGFQGGYSAYWKLADAAKDGSLPREGSKDFENLKNACAEAVVYKRLRESAGRGQATPVSQAIFDPIAQTGIIGTLLSDPFKPLGNKIITSMGSKTPDIVFMSAPVSDGQFTIQPVLQNVLDPNDPTASHTIKQPYSDKILIAPVEVTTAGGYSNILAKVKKVQSYKNVFGNSGRFAFVPVLVVDRAEFLKIAQEDRYRALDLMTRRGGRIQLIDGLINSASIAAKSIAPELVQAMAAYEQSKRKELEFKDNKKQTSLSSRLFEKAKELLKDFKQSFSLKNKPQEEATSTTPKKRLASEVYQEMVSSFKETASYPQKAGIDIVNNSNHLDLMIATQLVKKNIDYEKVLKQSPNYRSKEPAAANLWLTNIIEDGISMNKEYYLDSTGSQKIIRSYDNDASRPPEKSNFEKLSESAQRYNSEYARDREGLLISVAKASIRAGMNPEQVLRESPDYLLAMSGKGEALVEKTIEKAESAVQAEKSRAEQQAQEKNNSRDRGYER